MNHTHLDILRSRFLVQCKDCKRWRFRNRGEIFYSCKMLPPVILNPNWVVRIEPPKASK